MTLQLLVDECLLPQRTGRESHQDPSRHSWERRAPQHRQVLVAT
jgi:hypothetical protein